VSHRRILIAVVAAAALALVAGQAGAARPTLDTARLGPDGLGPVRIGMTVPQARAATRSRLVITRRSGSCAVLERAGRGDGVSFLLTDGVVRAATVAVDTPLDLDVATTRGLRLISDEREVRRLYGAPFFTARDAEAGGLQLVYRPRPAAAPARRYVFTTGRFGALNGRYVVAMSVGELPEVRAGGCT
jgi:hypothetical protein